MTLFEQTLDTLQQLRTISNAILTTQDTPTQKNIHGLVEFRLISDQVQSKKQKTNEARERMDRAHLALQNLLYEQQHLERELDACRDFKTLYDQLELISESEFRSEATQDVLDACQDEHQLMLHRLQNELSERKRLLKLFQEEDNVRKQKIEELKAKKEKMDKLENQFEVLVKVSKSLHESIQPESPEEGQVVSTMVAESSPMLLARNPSRGPNQAPLSREASASPAPRPRASASPGPIETTLSGSPRPMTSRASPSPRPMTSASGSPRLSMRPSKSAGND